MIIPELTGKLFNIVTEAMGMDKSKMDAQQIFNERTNKSHFPFANPSIKGHHLKGWENYETVSYDEMTFRPIHGVYVSREWLWGEDIYMNVPGIWVNTAENAVDTLEKFGWELLTYDDWMNVLGFAPNIYNVELPITLPYTICHRDGNVALIYLDTNTSQDFDDSENFFMKIFLIYNTLFLYKHENTDSYGVLSLNTNSMNVTIYKEQIPINDFGDDKFFIRYKLPI